MAVLSWCPTSPGGLALSAAFCVGVKGAVVLCSTTSRENGVDLSSRRGVIIARLVNANVVRKATRHGPLRRQYTQRSTE